MRVDRVEYRRIWEQSLSTQPQVDGPADYWYQRLGQFARAIACESTYPFALPVGVTAEVTGIGKEFVGSYLGRLVQHGVLRVASRGEPGRYTRYVWGGRR